MQIRSGPAAVISAIYSYDVIVTEQHEVPLHCVGRLLPVRESQKTCLEYTCRLLRGISELDIII